MANRREMQIERVYLIKQDIILCYLQKIKSNLLSMAYEAFQGLHQAVLPCILPSHVSPFLDYPFFVCLLVKFLFTSQVFA